MKKEEEKKMAELKSSLGFNLAFKEAGNPLRFIAWFGSYLFLKMFRSHHGDFFEFYMASRARREQSWKKKHADPLFGLPDEDYEWLESVYWIFSNTRFSHARVSKVTVQTKGAPSTEHQKMFLWLENKISNIQKLVPDLLVAESKLEGDIECYGEADSERAAAAFVPANIFRIEFRDSSPVFWDLHAHHPTEQDVNVTVEGSDEVVTRAFLSM